MNQRLISLAYRNVRVNWRHTLSALLSIVAAFFSIVFFEGYISDLSDLYYDGYHSRAMFADFVIENVKAQSPEGRGDPMSVAVTKEQQQALLSFKLQHSDFVAESVRFLTFSGLISNGKTTVVFYAKASDISEGKIVREPHWAWNALYGRPLFLASNPNSLMLGLGLAKSLGCRPVKLIPVVTSTKGYVPEVRPFECDTADLQMSVTTASGQMNAMDFEVSGFEDGGYQQVDSRYVIMPLPAAQQLMNTENASYVTFLLKNEKYRAQFEKAFKEEIINKYPQLKFTRWQDHEVGELYRRTLDLMSIFRNFVVLVIISITTLSVMNTSVKAIKERTQEIGTLRSLGFQIKDIRNIFLWESFFLSAFGIFVGTLVALIISFIVNNAGITYKAGILSLPVAFSVRVNIMAYLFSSLMLVILGLMVTSLVCRETLQRKIVENLGHV